jgi:hypothetical protein
MVVVDLVKPCGYNDDDDNDNNNNNNSLTCRLNGTSVYYKASIMTKIKHKRNTYSQKKNTKHKSDMVGKSNIKEVLEQKS